MSGISPNTKPFKLEACANPISPNVFCADPTGVEYEGRLYIFGTNDHHQYDAVGDNGRNSYEHIRSFVIFSTEDMVNREYHGIIDTAKIAPWIIYSWAPSIVSRASVKQRHNYNISQKNPPYLNGHVRYGGLFIYYLSIALLMSISENSCFPFLSIYLVVPLFMILATPSE